MVFEKAGITQETLNDKFLKRYIDSQPLLKFTDAYETYSYSLWIKRHGFLPGQKVEIYLGNNEKHVVTIE
jgi:hypothetical protein